MKLRFKIDQAEAFRYGIDMPTSVAVINVNPGEMPLWVRNLIADRMHQGIDVCCLSMETGRPEWRFEDGDHDGVLIEASDASIEGLVEAVVRDHKRVVQEFESKGSPGSAPESVRRPLPDPDQVAEFTSRLEQFFGDNVPQ